MSLWMYVNLEKKILCWYVISHLMEVKHECKVSLCNGGTGMTSCLLWSHVLYHRGGAACTKPILEPFLNIVTVNQVPEIEKKLQIG